MALTLAAFLAQVVVAFGAHRIEAGTHRVPALIYERIGDAISNALRVFLFESLGACFRDFLQPLRVRRQIFIVIVLLLQFFHQRFRQATLKITMSELLE